MILIILLLIIMTTMTLIIIIIFNYPRCPTDMIPLLLEAADLMTYFSYEDVFWTGLAVEVINEPDGMTLNMPLDPESIKDKFEGMKVAEHLIHNDRLTVRRENVPNWRVDYRPSDSLHKTLVKVRAAAIVHGIRWDRDSRLVSALRDIAAVSSLVGPLKGPGGRADQTSRSKMAARLHGFP